MRIYAAAAAAEAEIKQDELMTIGSELAVYSASRTVFSLNLFVIINTIFFVRYDQWRLERREGVEVGDSCNLPKFWAVGKLITNLLLVETVVRSNVQNFRLKTPFWQNQ